MILRVNIPQQVFLYGRSDSQLESVSVSFSYERYAVTLTFEGGKVIKPAWADPNDNIQYYRESTHAILVITETERSGKSITDLIAPTAHEDLLDLIEGATMRAIRVVRNVGFVSELPESLPRNNTPESILLTWHPEVSFDGAAWTEVLPDALGKYSVLIGMGSTGRRGFSAKAELDISYWSRIKEVLEDNLEIAPEDEFLTNTVGHLRTGNFRLAIIDAVIGLEIVLTKYLRCYLATIKKMPKKRIDSFLLNDFGLTPRLAGMLDLTMHESYLRDIKLDQVLKAVTWRNNIVHKTGQLPTDVPVETVREHIEAVLDLARTLAELYVNTSAAPDREKIAEKLKSNWSGRILWPQLWIKPWHKVYAEVGCDIGDPLTEDEMKAIAEELGGYLKARDKRFDPTSDLQVNFTRYLGESIGRYIFGQVLLAPAITSGSASSASPSSGAGSTEASVT